METFKSRHELLTADELRILRALNIGYGNFSLNAARVGIHKNTYRYIINRGRGRRENIRKIKALLLNHPSDESDTY